MSYVVPTCVIISATINSNNAALGEEKNLSTRKFLFRTRKFFILSTDIFFILLTDYFFYFEKKTFTKKATSGDMYSSEKVT
jgi:hypothetical protein